MPHFRGCAGELNRLPRAYHSGDSEEFVLILARFAQEAAGAPLYAAGVSLGGNALLKWAGERGDDAGHTVAAIAAVSAPLDLAGCGHHLARGFNRVYTRHFLQTLKAISAARLERFPGLFDEQRMRRAVNLYEFDDAVTAPIHGFAGADDYWRRASAKPWLPGIRIPTLVLNALNDPFLPARFLPSRDEAASSVRLEYPAHGGHVGFVTGGFPGSLDWMPQRLLHYFDTEESMTR
ncbi:MAG: YheT family hydrolase [Actinomycetota bacterium]